jgi:hypothetical protein
MFLKAEKHTVKRANYSMCLFGKSNFYRSPNLDNGKGEKVKSAQDGGGQARRRKGQMVDREKMARQSDADERGSDPNPHRKIDQPLQPMGKEARSQDGAHQIG